MTAPVLAAPDFDRVLCAVGVGPGHREAVHQAISLCAAGGSLRLLAARRDGPDDLALPRDLTEMQARGALELAVASARTAALDPTASLLRGRPVEEALLAEAEGHDLLVLAARTWLGRQVDDVDPAAMRIAMLAPCPVLLARGSSRARDGRLSVRVVDDVPGRAVTVDRIRRAAEEAAVSLLVEPKKAAAAEPAARDAFAAIPALASA